MNKTWLLIIVASLSFWTIVIIITLRMTSGEPEISGTPLPKVKAYVEIGNGIERTNDLEMGVVCYRVIRGISCLKVN